MIGGILHNLFAFDAISTSFRAALQSTLIPEYSVGSPTPTFTRATTAYVTDFEDLLKPVLSGEARFTGARRVRNRITSTNGGTETLTSWLSGAAANETVTGGQTDPDGGLTAHKIVTSNTTLNGGRYNTCGGVASFTGVDSVWLRGELGGEQVSFGDASNRTTVTLTTVWKRYSSTAGTRGTSNAFVIYSNPLAQTWYAWHPMQEDVTGQSNQNPSEYVSVGVLSAPFHGANVDGVKYYTTENGNTVASNVVTEAGGAPIAAATLKGYLADGARTNLCLQSEDFGTTWVNVATTESVNAAASPDGATTADKIIETAAAGYHTISQSITFTAAAHTFSVFLKSGERTWAIIREDINGTPVDTYFDLSTGVVGSVGAGRTAAIQAFPNGWYRCSVTATATAAAHAVTLGPTTGNSGGAYAGDITKGIYAWGAQVEAATFASSYIKTTTVAVTRNADVLTYAHAGNADATVGTCYAELSTLYTAGSGSDPVALSFGTSTYQFAVPTGSASTVIRMNDGTTSATKSGLSDLSTGVRKRVCSWGTNQSITGDGLAPQTAAFDGAMASAAIAIGCFSSGNNSWYGNIGNVRIYGRQLSDAQLRALTA